MEKSYKLQEKKIQLLQNSLEHHFQFNKSSIHYY